MSYVTNIILHMGINEGDKINEVNRFFETDGGKGFVLVDSPDLPPSWYGGSKMLEVDLAIGAFNSIDLEGLKKHIKSIEWNFPEHIELLICDQDDVHFTIWNFNND